jgi:hypothetical protein
VKLYHEIFLKNFSGLQFFTVDRMGLVSLPSSKGRTITFKYLGGSKRTLTTKGSSLRFLREGRKEKSFCLLTIGGGGGGERTFVGLLLLEQQVKSTCFSPQVSSWRRTTMPFMEQLSFPPATGKHRLGNILDPDFKGIVTLLMWILFKFYKIKSIAVRYRYCSSYV